MRGKIIKINVPLWAVAVVGFAVVMLLAIYIISAFQESTAIEDSAYAELYNDTAAPTKLTLVEQKRIDLWIKHNALNKYGDAPDTKYTDGPLKSSVGVTLYKDRFEYIVAHHADRPWNL